MMADGMGGNGGGEGGESEARLVLGNFQGVIVLDMGLVKVGPLLLCLPVPPMLPLPLCSIEIDVILRRHVLRRQYVPLKSQGVRLPASPANKS